MQIFKKISAVILVFLLTLSIAGCANTRYMLTVDGEQIPAGVYLYYALNVYTDAVDNIQGQQATFNPLKKADVENAVFNGQPLLDYVQDKAIEGVLGYVASMREFKRLGLSLDEESQTKMEDYTNLFWNEFDKNLQKNGISKASISKIIKVMYYNQEIFNSYYGEEGSKGIRDVDLRKFYIENNARVKYLAFNYLSYTGETLIGDAKQEVQDLAKDYAEQIKAGTDFEAVRSEYNSVSESKSVSYSSYSQSVSVSESEAVAATETDPETGETLGTSTTTTTEETVTTTTVAVTTESVTTTLQEGLTITDNSDTASVATTTTTTTNVATTTTEKYANEIIFTKVTTAEVETPDIEIEGGVTTTTQAPSYTPNKDVHDAIFAQDKYDIPFTVDSSTASYLIVRYDISERMTEDDLWTEATIDETRVTAYQKAFLDEMENLYKTYNTERNESAFARYVPWKFEIEETV